MECNKDDAIRSKEIAERKFKENDIAGAKKFALKAKALFEPLEGICHMILALDVYLRAQTKIGGHDDWYGILEVSVLANEETIKRQYKKLALQTHPDKNNFVGAAGAFKLVSDAWSVLSDKNKRTAYDQMRYVGSIGAHQNSQINVRSTSNFTMSSNVRSTSIFTMSSMSGFSTMSGMCGLRNKNSVRAPHSNMTRTFWTYCGSCNMGFEYSREYVGRYLKCSLCQKVFLAVEVPSQSVPIYTNGPRTMDNNIDIGGSAVHNTDRSVDNINISGSAVHNSNRSMKTAKRSVDDDKNAAWQSTSSSHIGDPSVLTDPAKRKSRSTTGTSVPKRRKVSHGELNFESSNIAEISFRKVLKKFDVRGILKQKMKFQIQDKLEGINNKSNVKNKGKIGKDNGKDLANKRVDSKEKCQVQSSKHIGSQGKEKIWNWRSREIHVVYTRRNKVNKNESEVAPIGDSSSKQQQEPSDVGSNEMSVPDANFYNFGDHSENSFENGQVWAIYDEEDGMPRYYALIQKVVSTHPFEVRLAFLKAKGCNEFGTSNWISCGFSKTCGDFMVGASEITDRLNGFSHVVAWEKGLGNFIRIFPKKGDIWALYQNWSPNWNEFTPDDTMYKYELVEVLDSYNSSEGISVIPIIKMQGLVSVFKPLLDPTKSRRIPKEEMLRFSHQVPFHVLTGEEAQNSPKGCYELDPGSTPKELLQVVPI